MPPTREATAPTTSTRRRLGLGLLLTTIVWAPSGLSGCGDSAQGPVVQGPGVPGPVARLTATESRFVPGRLDLDGRRSEYVGEGGRIRSHTYTVRDRNTGETVYGPVSKTRELGQSLLKVYLPAGEYVASLTVEAEPVPTTGDLSTASSDTSAATDTAEEDVDLDAEITSDSSDCGLTCSSSSSAPDQVACTLPSTSDCYSVDLSDVMDIAAGLKSDIGEDTTMWIQAWGGSGSVGADCIFSGGSGGDGGFAQLLTTVSGFSDAWGTTTLYYYLGNEGGYDDGWCGSGGTGGASTIVSIREPTSDDYLTIDDLVVLAGGGGGGGKSALTYGGGNGGDGGSAISAVGASSTGDGASASDGGAGGIGSSSEIGGDGGAVTQGTCNTSKSSPSWENEVPTLDGSAGAGGASGDCQSGGGGGGYGGGGGASNDYGGGGGGSYSSASTTTDGDAPTSYQSHSGDGEVVITFNLD